MLSTFVALVLIVISPVHAEDNVARARLSYLATRSATMKQMLGILMMSPTISVRLRSNTTLWLEFRRKALGRLWVHGSRIVALLEFDSGGARPLQELEAVAHEMAHAVEVACLPSLPGIDHLRGQLLLRGRNVAGAPGTTIETPFAADAGRQVVQEALEGRTGMGRLPELAQKYKLDPPCGDPGLQTSVRGGTH